MVFLVGIAILICCLVLLVLAVLVRKCPKLMSCYQGLKKKLAYGMPIRYLLLSTLKMQMTICGGLAIGGLVVATAKTPEKGSGFLA